MLNRVCMFGDHEQKQIECVCTYKHCNLISRFVCAKCLITGNHRHQQQNNEHLKDKVQLYQYLKEELDKQKTAQGMANRSNFIKQNINIIHQYLKNITNLMDKIDLEESINSDILQKIKQNGFNELYEVELNNILNINRQHEKQIDIYQQFKKQAEILQQQSAIIKDWCQEQIDIIKFQIADLQMIHKFMDKFVSIDQGGDTLLTSAISNDFKYIVSGGNAKVLKIWSYDCTHIKSHKLDNSINICKFTDDSKFLYVGSQQFIYQIDVHAQFKIINKLKVHDKVIFNIYCITNTLLLSSSYENIVKTNFSLKQQQQQLLISAHEYFNVFGLDYNQKLNVILSGSDDQSISLWDGDNGELILEKQNAHSHNIYQVLFIVKTNQIISLDCNSNFIIWNINIQYKKLDKYKGFSDCNGIYNISLVLDQQYIVQVSQYYIQILSIYGEQIRLFLHDIKDVYLSKTIQPKSMKAIIIEGEKTLNICKLEL